MTTSRSLFLGLTLAVSACALAVPAAAQRPAKADGKLVASLTVGFVAAIDQVALPVAVEQGFFEKYGLDVKLAPAFASGVDALNAMQAGNVQFVQVGTPLMGAMISGMDVAYVGGFIGSAVRVRMDETQAVIARQGSGIDPKNYSTFKGKKIGSTPASTNHIYVRNLLASKGLKPEDYTLVNTAPPDMAVAMKTGGVDAIACWDPWTVITLNSNPGSYQISRGGGYVANVGYIAAMREFVEKNPDVVERFLAARAEADLWVRKNPAGAVDVATRWIPGTSAEIAGAVIQYTQKSVDGRLSGCTVLAMEEGMQFTLEMRKLTGKFDVAKHVRPQASMNVVKKYPELFADLPPIPQEAMLPGNDMSKWNREAATKVCTR